MEAMCQIIDVLARTSRHQSVTVLVLFILVLRPTVFSGEYVNVLYSDNLNGRLCSQGTRSEVADITILDCTRACATDGLCFSFIYDDTTTTCHLYNQALNATSKCSIYADQSFSYYYVYKLVEGSTAGQSDHLAETTVKCVHSEPSVKVPESSETSSSREEEGGDGD